MWLLPNCQKHAYLKRLIQLDRNFSISFIHLFQALAAKFVHDNAEMWGADNSRVSYWGISAGAAIVGQLAMSPHSRGKVLFEKYPTFGNASSEGEEIIIRYERADS